MINVSEGGIALQMPEPLTPALVPFQSKELKIEGIGMIRHCRSTRAHYIVSFEFEGQSRWVAPKGEIREPDSALRSVYKQAAKANQKLSLS